MASKKDRFFPVKYPKNASEIFDENRTKRSPRTVLGGCVIRSDVLGAVWMHSANEFSFFPYPVQWGVSGAFAKVLWASNWAGGIVKFFDMLCSDDIVRTVPCRIFEFQLRSLITNV